MEEGRSPITINQDQLALILETGGAGQFSILDFKESVISKVVLHQTPFNLACW
jgi:hypothetical protein